MDTCRRCGHTLGVGRFCTNCGHPVGAPVPDSSTRGSWRTDTAERPRVETLPPAEHDTRARPAPTGHRHVDETRRTAGWVPWIAGLAVMLLLAALGLWLLLGGDDDPTARDTSQQRPTSEEPVAEQPSRDDRTPEGRATMSPEPQVDPTDLARFTTVVAPAPAPPNRDVSGNQVRYEASNMVDGVPETCWRMPEDGTGETITFTFDEPTELSEVGLVNGYAKTAQDAQGPLDWYAGNRRVLEVEWAFDDGTVLGQELGQTREMQVLPVDDLVTEVVTLRLVEVSPPGPGRASRDYTAISDVRLLGAPA